ncbi:MAG: hypothetical protein WDM70_09005 [Nitrosomonadales bacterium]
MPEHDGGGLASKKANNKSRFSIYCDRLNFVMSSCGLDEEAATEAIMLEFGGYSNNLKNHSVKSVTKIDWKVSC